MNYVKYSLYILQYMDEPAVRKSVERVLSKVESSNKFAKAISHGNNQQLIVATYREQLTAEGCKRLIANSINCWNLLNLSGSLSECKNPLDREALLKIYWPHPPIAGSISTCLGSMTFQKR